MTPSPPNVCPACGSPLPTGVRPEFCPVCLLRDASEPAADIPFLPDTLRDLGDYELLEEIARGGMGVVFRARQRSLGRIVAVKLLLGGQFAGQQAFARFRQEASAAAALQHPHIVAIHEIGEHEGQPYFSMDFVEGRTLAALVREGPLSARRAARHAETIARAVHHAHANGVLHRDLKPSNVLIDAFDQPRVTDFGLAKRLDEPTPDPLTVTGQLIGSPGYASPEQARGAEVGVASDIYALGALLYHLLTGRAPFQGESIPAVLRQVAESEPITPSRLNPSVPRDLETVCLRCLEKDPARRYGTAEEFAEDLARFQRGEPVHARPVGDLARAWRWSRRHPVASVLGVALVAALLTLTVGGLVAAARIRHAERVARLRLADSLLEQARSLESTDRMGRRWRSRELVEQALELNPKDEAFRSTARDVYAAALAVDDARFVAVTNLPAGADPAVFLVNPSAARMARIEHGTNVVVTRLDSGTVVDRFPITGGPITAIEDFSRDGRYLVLREASALSVWNADTGELVDRTTGLHVVHAISADGSTLVVEDANAHLRILDLASNNPPRRIEPEPDSGAEPVRGWHCLALSPDARHLAGVRAVGDRVQFVDLATGTVEFEFKTGERIRSMAWSPDGRRVGLGSGNGRVIIVEVASRASRWARNGPPTAVQRLAFSPDNDSIVAAFKDRTVQGFRIPNGQTLFNIGGDATLLAFSDGGKRLATVGREGAIGWLQLETSDEFSLRLVTSSAKSVTQLAASPDGRHVTFGAPTGIALLGGPDFMPVQTLASEEGFDSGFAPDGGAVWYAGSSGVHRRTIDPATGTSLFGDPAEILHGSQWHGLAVGPDGKTLGLANAASNGVYLLDLAASSPLPRRLAHHVGVQSVAFSADGRFIASSSDRDRHVRVWDARDGTAVFQTPAGAGARARFSPGGKWLATFGERFGLWTVPDWQAVPGAVELSGYSRPGVATFSADGRMLALALDHETIALFELPGLKPLMALHNPGYKLVNDLLFSPDGSRLWFATGRGTVSCWELSALRDRLRAVGLDWDRATDR